MSIDVSHIGDTFDWKKEPLQEMIETFGMKETVHRWAWYRGVELEAAAEVIRQYLEDDWVDEKGVPCGHSFWGEF